MRQLFILFILTGIVFSGCSRQIANYKIGPDYAIHFSSQGAEITPQEDVIHASQTIPSPVVQIAWNNRYILAKQVEKNIIGHHPDAHIIHNESIHYWIIDVVHNKRFGPYTNNQIEAKKKIFHISNLELQNVEKFLAEIK